jgi:hypothetical protein
MQGKAIIILIIVIVLVIAGSIGLLSSTDTGSSIDGTSDIRDQNNGTAASTSEGGEELTPTQKVDCVLILSEGNIFVDGETGHGSDTLDFSVTDVHRLSIDIHVISELCVACGGQGKGEVTVIVKLPSGEVAFREVYTSTTDVNLLFDAPQTGSWQVIIDGVAFGSDYKVGYEMQVYVIEK